MRYALLVLLLAAIPTHALAASLSLSPTTVSVVRGQTFTLSLLADPTRPDAHATSTAITSIRAHIAFDPAVLQETAFSFASSWLALPEPGYDTTDNANGTVIKTAGYPGGIERAVPFGTITFRVIAPSAGKTLLVIAGDTEMLDGENANQFSGTSGGAIVQVGAPSDVASATTVRATKTVELSTLPFSDVTPASSSFTSVASSLPAAALLSATPIGLAWWLAPAPTWLVVVLAFLCVALGLVAGYAFRAH